MLTFEAIAAVATWKFVRGLALKMTIIASLAGGVYLATQSYFVKKERASVTQKGDKTRAKVAEATRNADVEKVIRSICRDC